MGNNSILHHVVTNMKEKSDYNTIYATLTIDKKTTNMYLESVMEDYSKISIDV